MNTMGKILVFLNLLFALVVGGFLIIDFGTRKNWKAYAEALEQNLTAAKSDSDQFLAYKQEVRNELTKLHQQLQQKQVELVELEEKRKKDLQDWEKKFNDADLVRDKAMSNQTVYRMENERMEKEVKLLRDQKDQLESIIVAMEKKMDQVTQLYQQAQNDRSSVESRNLAMLQQLRQLERELAESRTSPAGGAASNVKDRNGPNPPTFYIKGIIKKIEGTEKNLVEISLGSDHGLKEEHTLEMYRFRPQAEYIGMIRIDHVEPRTAVGRVVRSGVYGTTKNPRIGDEVASRIVPR